MATYERREVTTTRVEFDVPASSPWGACWVEVQKAIAAVIEEMRTAGTLGLAEVPSDDRIRVTPGDEKIIVSYEIKS